MDVALPRGQIEQGRYLVLSLSTDTPEEHGETGSDNSRQERRCRRTRIETQYSVGFLFGLCHVNDGLTRGGSFGFCVFSHQEVSSRLHSFPLGLFNSCANQPDSRRVVQDSGHPEATHNDVLLSQAMIVMTALLLPQNFVQVP